MIITSEMVDILDYADEVTSQIVHSTLAHSYFEAKKNLHEDKEAQALISEFTIWKEKYEEVKRFGKYHPNYREYSFKLREVKRSVDLNDTIAAFKKAEKDLEDLLNEISQMIGKSVSTHIKVPSSNPYFDTMSHGSGCGGGGSCGCSTKKKSKKAIS